MNLENAGKDWTPEDYTVLRAWFFAGAPLRDLKCRLRRTARAVSDKLVEMQLLTKDRNGFYYRNGGDGWCNQLDIRYIDEGLGDEED